MSIKIYPDGKTASVVNISRPIYRGSTKQPPVKSAASIGEAKKAISQRLYRLWKLNWEKQQGATKEALRELAEVFSKYDTVIRFYTDINLRQTVMSVVNKKSGKVVLQIPSEYTMSVRRYAKLFPGLFLNETV